MTIVPTLRRLRQESCHKTQAVLSSVESGVSPISEERKEPARFLGTPGGAAQHSSRGCWELPGFTGTLKQAAHPTSSRQPWLSTSKYHTLHLYQPQLWSCQLPSMGLLRHTDSSRMGGCGHVSSQADWRLAFVTGPGLPQAHHCQMFSKSFLARENN